MESKSLNCVVCPVGCLICVDFDNDGKIVKIYGNECQRGELYAQSELTEPKRILTRL